MSFKKVIGKFAVTSIMAFAVIPVMGQDLIARQAPVDRKNKAVEQIYYSEIMPRVKPIYLKQYICLPLPNLIKAVRTER